MFGITINLKVPIGFQLLRLLPFPTVSRERKLLLHRVFILFLTFAAYTCYHASRKPISVVKNALISCNGSEPDHGTEDSTNCTSWIDQLNYVHENEAQRLEGVLDSTYLFAYAFFMFFSGIVAERVNLRYFLSLGMIFSGIFTILFGLAKYIDVHHIAYFIVIQFFGGAFQTTGWPSVVTVVANWFGKGKKGLIFGIWNSHTSVGNILGSAIAGVFVDDNWGLSFIVPGALVAACGIIIWLFMVARPEDIGIDLSHENVEETEGNEQRRLLPNRSTGSGEMTPLLLSEESEEDFYGEAEKSPARLATTSSTAALTPDVEAVHVVENEKAISFLGALKIPGVIEFSLCLFFAKLVSYVFLYWLPTFIKEKGENVSASDAAFFSILFDVGGIVGGIIAGLATDWTGKSATTCAVMLIGAIPALFGYQYYGEYHPLDGNVQNTVYFGHVGFLLLTGLLVNGPYALITTAVSAELGTHKSLEGSAKALATVTSVIDGTGSIGAAVGPFLAGAIGLDNVFYMLMASDVVALILLARLVKGDIDKTLEARRQRRRGELYARQS